jgi:glycosyltransferase involved in cell wall biosynthesis
MAGVPCVVTDLPEMRKYVTTNNCGFVLSSLDSESLIRLVDQVMSSDLTEIKKNARVGAINNSWEKQELVMTNVYRDIFGEGRDSNS